MGIVLPDCRGRRHHPLVLFGIPPRFQREQILVGRVKTGPLGLCKSLVTSVGDRIPGPDDLDVLSILGEKLLDDTGNGRPMAAVTMVRQCHFVGVFLVLRQLGHRSRGHRGSFGRREISGIHILRSSYRIGYLACCHDERVSILGRSAALIQSRLCSGQPYERHALV